MEQREAPEFRVGNPIKKTYNKERDMKCYLAGPVELIDTWREKASKDLKEIGVEPINPMEGEEIRKLDNGMFTSQFTPKEILERNIRDLVSVKESNGICLMKLDTSEEGRRPTGALLEFEWCVLNEVPVVWVVSDRTEQNIRCSPWTAEQATHIAESMEDALGYIKSNYAVH